MYKEDFYYFNNTININNIAKIKLKKLSIIYYNQI